MEKYEITDDKIMGFCCIKKGREEITIFPMRRRKEVQTLIDAANSWIEMKNAMPKEMVCETIYGSFLRLCNAGR